MAYRKSVWKSLDRTTLVLYLFLVAYGWLTICGASYDFDHVFLFDIFGRPGMQLIWIAISFILAYVVLSMEADFYDVFSYHIYIASMLLMLLAVFFAPDIKGSHSWLVMGPLRLQPAEFAKFATALTLSKVMSEYAFDLGRVKYFGIVIAVLAIPIALMFFQNEAGTAVVFLAFFFVFYREGLSGFVLLGGLCAIIYAILELKFGHAVIGDYTPLGALLIAALAMLVTQGVVFYYDRWIDSLRSLLIIMALSVGAGLMASLFLPVNFVTVAYVCIGASMIALCYYSFKRWTWRYVYIALFSIASLGFRLCVNYAFGLLEPHQQKRILISLALEDDPSGAGYNVNQSLIAIGSGRFVGKGFLNGTQTKLKYVPEQDTDFIFCTVGEEQGFIGCFLLLSIYLWLVLRILYLAEKQPILFKRSYGYSVAAILFVHILINIGMALGLTPVIGIPLPFFSYGGSSLCSFTILLFIFLRFDAARKERQYGNDLPFMERSSDSLSRRR
ncbi:MAG: rod shape-determining protein RodA [Tannerellaceae bacterium]|jgi:rod shape determining protein RodA|nr:rod shape-determining protein RodA [Tannerellaceae bacterium]